MYVPDRSRSLCLKVHPFLISNYLIKRPPSMLPSDTVLRLISITREFSGATVTVLIVLLIVVFIYV